MSLILHNSFDSVNEPSSIMSMVAELELFPRRRKYSFNNRTFGLVLTHLEGPDEKA